MADEGTSTNAEGAGGAESESSAKGDATELRGAIVDAWREAGGEETPAEHGEPDAPAEGDGDASAEGDGEKPGEPAKPDGTEKYRGIARRAARAQKKVEARMSELRAEEQRIGLTREERAELDALREIKGLVGKSPREVIRRLGIDINALTEQILAEDTPEERARQAARVEIEAAEKQRREAEEKQRAEHARAAAEHERRAFLTEAADPEKYPFLAEKDDTSGRVVLALPGPAFVAASIEIGREIHAELQRLDAAHPGQGWDRLPTNEEILREYNAREAKRFAKRGAGVPSSTTPGERGASPGESRGKRGGVRTLTNGAGKERSQIAQPATTREGTVSALAAAIRGLGASR